MGQRVVSCQKISKTGLHSKIKWYITTMRRKRTVQREPDAYFFLTKELLHRIHSHQDGLAILFIEY